MHSLAFSPTRTIKSPPNSTPEALRTSETLDPRKTLALQPCFRETLARTEFWKLELGESDPAEEKCERGTIEGRKEGIGSRLSMWEEGKCENLERERRWKRERERVRERKKACG